MSPRVPLFILASWLCAFAQTGTVFIETIAGATVFDNLPARQTPLVQPQSVWVHPNGDVYIADGNFVIRRIRGNISTIVAGGGRVVDDSIGVPAKDAYLDYPSGLAGATTRYLYISDIRHNRVRRLNYDDGTISTVVGRGTNGFSGDNGRGAFAELSSPTALAMNPSGEDLYIADTSNYVIRKFNTRTGIITTVAGIPGKSGYTGDSGPAIQARLGTARGLAVDAAGNLFVADLDHYVVRKITANGVISTFAGNGKQGFSGDGGPAAQASIDGCYGLTVDAAGNLYIADTSNYRVRRVTPQGIISTYAGRSRPRTPGVENIPAVEAFLRGPGGIAFDSQGNLYIPEVFGELVRRVAAGTGIITTVAGTSDPYDGNAGLTAPLNLPTSVATDSQGNIFVADTGHFRIRRIDRITKLITTVAGDGKESVARDDPNAGGFTQNSIGRSLSISVDPNDRLLIADRYNGVIRGVNLKTGVMSTIIDLNDWEYDNDKVPFPASVVGDTFGNIYFSDSANHYVLEYTPGDKLYFIAGTGKPGFAGANGPADSAQLSAPEGLALDGENGLFVCDPGNHRVRWIDLNANTIKTFAGDGDDDSNYDGYDAVDASLRSPFAVAIDQDGYTYIADSVAHQVREVDPDGIIYTLGGSGDRGFAGDKGPSVLARFDEPTGLAIFGEQLYVADSFNYRVRRFYVESVQNSLVADPPKLSFRTTRNGADPAPQLISLGTSFVGLNLSYSLLQIGGPWLTADEPKGSTPNVFFIYADPTGLTEGTYSATLIVRGVDAPDINIPVDFTIDPANEPRAVKLSPELTRFTVPQNGRDGQQVTVNSPGKTALNWSIRRPQTASWLTFNTSSGTTPATVDVSVNSTGLKTGTYSTVAYFEVTGGASSLYFVTMTVSESRATLKLDRDSILFEVIEGTTAAPPQAVSIYNSGSSDLRWTLAIPSSAGWVGASVLSGLVQPGGKPSVSAINISPAGLRAGSYSASIDVRADGAAGSPQVLGVRLRVLPANSDAHAIFDKSGLIFRGSPGSAIREQTIDVSSTGGVLSFSNSVRTSDGGKWLSVTPSNGSILSSAQKYTVRYLINTSGLPENVYTGTVTYSFSDKSTREVGVVLILRAGASDAQSAFEAGGKYRAAGCTPAKQVLVPATLPNNFALAVGWPIPLQVQVFDDCGAPSANSSVNVSFSNGDPPLVLGNLRNGQYAGTWTPGTAAASVTLSMRALQSGLAPAELKSNGRLSRDASPPPILLSGGVLNAGSGINTSLIAPGARLILRGANFPDTAAAATVVIGGASAKVLSSAPNEIQAIAPAQFDGLGQTFVIAGARGFSTSPETVSVVVADPGLYPLADGVSISTGGSLSVTATGMGAVDAAGKVMMQPTAKLGDLDAVIESATLPAGADGVYQLKIRIPSGSGGTMPLAVTQNGISSNQINVKIQ